jgi:hypothetical protein
MQHIQGDQKVSVHLMITIQKVTSNVQSDTPNCVLEDRVQCSTVIPNVLCDGHLQLIICVRIVRIH